MHPALLPRRDLLRLTRGVVNQAICRFLLGVLSSAMGPTPSDITPVVATARAEGSTERRPHRVPGLFAEASVVGDHAHPLGRRTTGQNDGHRHPGSSAYRHVGLDTRPNHRLAGLGPRMTFIPRRGRAHLHPIRLAAIPGPALRQERVGGPASGLGGPARAAANSQRRYAVTGPLVDVTTLAPSRHARADAIRR